MRNSLIPSRSWTAEELMSLEMDDLTVLKGISVNRESTLNHLGIFTYSQLVGYDAKSLSDQMGSLVSENTVRRWQEQAKSME